MDAALKPRPSAPLPFSVLKHACPCPALLPFLPAQEVRDKRQLLEQTLAGGSQSQGGSLGSQGTAGPAPVRLPRKFLEVRRIDHLHFR